MITHKIEQKENLTIEDKTNLISELLSIIQTLDDSNIPDRLLLEIKVFKKIEKIIDSIKVKWKELFLSIMLRRKLREKGCIQKTTQVITNLQRTTLKNIKDKEDE